DTWGFVMAVKEIIRMGHPTLRLLAEPYPIEKIGSDDCHELIEDLRDTLTAAGGIGLAAPQINIPVQVAVVDIPAGPTRYGDLWAVPFSVYINPKLTALDNSRAGYWEGCLSVPGLRGYVVRPQRVKVDFIDLDGNEQSLIAEGFTATVFQHEFDHLASKLYIDHISDTRLLVFEDQFIEHGVDELTSHLQAASLSGS
ncbi:MAG: peptide deformylase, partial [Luminiphilus sp.]|nr:peptide deformylase [Luminiphilus sp.]